MHYRNNHKFRFTRAIDDCIRETAQHDSPDLAMHNWKAQGMLLDESYCRPTSELELRAQPRSLIVVPFDR